MCTIYWPDTIPCGKHGTCSPLDNSTCFCASGYSSFGDFSISSSNPCDVDVSIVAGLWVMTLAFGVIILIAAIWSLWSRNFKFPANAWRAWSLPLFCIVQSALTFGFSVPKIVNPTKFIVGGDLAATILHCVFVAVGGTMMLVLLGGFARANSLTTLSRLGPDEKRRFNRGRKRFDVVLVVGEVVLCVTAFLPLIIVKRPDLLFQVLAAHGSVLCIYLLTLGTVEAPRLLWAMVQTVDKSLSANQGKMVGTSNDQLMRISFKLKVVWTVAIVAFPTFSTIVLIFALWRSASIKLPYALPFVYAMILLAGTVSVWVTTTTQKNNISRPSLAFLRRKSSGLSPRRLTNLMSGAGSALLSGGNLTGNNPPSPIKFERHLASPAQVVDAAPLSV